jgi:hypothetical protein
VISINKISQPVLSKHPGGGERSRTDDLPDWSRDALCFGAKKPLRFFGMVLKLVEASGVEPMTFPTGVGTLFPSEQKKTTPFPEWFSNLVEVNGVEPMTFPTEVGTLFPSEQKKPLRFRNGFQIWWR